MGRVVIFGTAYILAFAAAAFAAKVCPSCAATMPDDYNFCEDCGSALAPMVTCPECGAKYPEGTVSCTCGYVFLKPKAITVTVTPAKATIYVNGVERAEGRAVIKLESGEAVEVEARLKGYDGVTRTLTYDAVEPGELALTLARAAKPAEAAKKWAVNVGGGFATVLGDPGYGVFSTGYAATAGLYYALVDWLACFVGFAYQGVADENPDENYPYPDPSREYSYNMSLNNLAGRVGVRLMAPKTGKGRWIPFAQVGLVAGNLKYRDWGRDYYQGNYDITWDYVTESWKTGLEFSGGFLFLSSDILGYGLTTGLTFYPGFIGDRRVVWREEPEPQDNAWVWNNGFSLMFFL
jgi:ribosomal protein L40E